MFNHQFEHDGVRRVGLGFCTILFALSTAACGQSDSCSTATAIATGAFVGNTSSATNDGAASCGESDTSPDLWYAYTPAEDCPLQVNTCTGTATFDTVVSIHSGCPGSVGNELVCDDDTCATQSVVSTSATTGVTYYIRVAGWQAATGDYVLNVSCPTAPASDGCGGAIPVTVGTYTGETFAATNDGSATCGDSATSPDVWYSFAATEDCLLRVDTCTSNWDTVLSLHTGCPGLEGNQLSCSDDSCSTQSRVATMAVSGNTYLIRVAGWQGATGIFTLHVQCAAGGGLGADAFIGELTDLQQFGREGAVIGCALDAPLCNFGFEPLDWFANPDPRHPFMTFNMYRLRDDRFEQIGQSWVKHGFGAAQEDACGFGCVSHADSTRLGVGCSDTYSAGLNAFQGLLGPRSEINPWTGAYTFPGSHLDLDPGPHNDIDHRLQIHDDDLDPALNAGAVYFVEEYIVCHDDVDHLNSVASELVGVSGTPGGPWSFDLSGSNTQTGPAIAAWPGATLTTIPPAPAGDGRCLLATKVTDNGDGTWHYAYVLYNHDLDRQVGSFRVPLPPGVTLTDVEFHAPLSHGEPYHNIPWTAATDPTGITWSTQPFAVNPTANPLRWGTAYNFRFNVNAPPAPAAATLGLYQPGTPAELSGDTQAPMPSGPIPAASEWALIILSAMLLSAGTIVFGKARAGEIVDA